MYVRDFNKSYLTAVEQRQGRGQDHQKQMSLTGSVALENLLCVCFHICTGADNTIPKPQELVGRLETQAWYKLTVNQRGL